MAILKGPIWSDYHRLNITSSAAAGIQGGLAARRATIFFRRLKNGQLPFFDKLNTAPDTTNQPEIEAWREAQEVKSNSQTNNNAPNSYPNTRRVTNRVDDYVAIIDVDYNGYDKGYNIIKLPAIPRELGWTTESLFSAIRPIGRNNPFFHFTGAEDRLEFEIDWFSTSWDKTEVLKNCRMIEALSKADGYSAPPHRVLLKWGQNDVLFSNMYFQVLSASYKFTRFNKAYLNELGILERADMLPVQAYQTVVLGRITDHNLSKKEIEFVQTGIRI